MCVDFKGINASQTSFIRRTIFNIPDLRSGGEQQLLGVGNWVIHFRYFDNLSIS